MRTKTDADILEIAPVQMGLDYAADNAHILTDPDERYTVYTLSGVRLLSEALSTAGLSAGIYIINRKKTIISK